MDWRAISRSRSRISTMDWRASSRSRSRPPPGQPFDQGNFSNSWSEGRFAFPPFGDPSNLPGPAFAMSKSFDTSYIAPNEHATSSSIPIPGIATQLRYGTPPLSSSLQSHAAHLAAVFEETGDYTGHSGLQYSSSGAHSGPSTRVTHPEPFQRPISASLQPSPLHMSALTSPLRQRLNTSTPDLQQPGGLLRHHLRKTSLDHMGQRSNAFSFIGGHVQGGSDEISAPYDPILVCITDVLICLF